ncbi:hypothetical protein M5689_006115 [Euphorbia peplus]|nr:hypothetical protein M5689_006115 [Euphorbia peplus]
MEEISKTAQAYYANLSENKKQLASQVFKSIDANGDGKISFKEYGKKKFKSISSVQFFQKLDKDGNGMLGFDEFIILQYLYVTERVYSCDGCKVFLEGAYFTCVQCFNNDSNNTYDLCCDCYSNRIHHQHSVFLDNYTLLHALRHTNQSTSGGAAEMISLAKFGVSATSSIVGLCSIM